MSGEPDFEDAIGAVVDSRLAGIHTALPGRIEKYDRATHMAEVKPLLKKRFTDGGEMELPVVANVPVVWPRTSEFEMSAPLKRGDGVLLVFSERSMDAWLSKGGLVAPPDGRKFDLSDAIAIPGLWSFKDAPPDGDSTDVVVRYKQSSIRIKSNGGIELGGDTDPLLALIDERLVAAFNAHTHLGVTVGSGATLAPAVPLVAANVATATTKAG